MGLSPWYMADAVPELIFLLCVEDLLVARIIHGGGIHIPGSNTQNLSTYSPLTLWISLSVKDKLREFVVFIVASPAE